MLEQKLQGRDKYTKMYFKIYQTAKWGNKVVPLVLVCITLLNNYYTLEHTELGQD